MDDVQRAYYRLRFENEFHRAKANGFQDLFVRLMGLAHKTDFIPCRPWGKQGDEKNDGFLQSERRLFQVYAPIEMSAARTVAKIKEDFEGAKAHWAGHFAAWTFVHNAYDGLPPDVLRVLDDIRTANPTITIEHWSLTELLDIFNRVSHEDLEHWFGGAPSQREMAALGYDELRIVLESIAEISHVQQVNVRPVPQGKLEANALSNDVAKLLTVGMSKAPLVRQFFDRWHDEAFGERMASAFRRRYEELRTDMRPDDVFTALRVWAGGREHGLPKHECAVLAVLAYFFSTCDIFEEPRG